MSNVSFDEEATYASSVPALNKHSTLTRWVLKSGLAKTDKGAQMVLLGVAVIAFVLALFLIINPFGSAKTTAIPVPSSTMP